MAELFTLPARATNSNGDNLSGAKLYFYATGTTTPRAVYSDSRLTTPHANPVVADSGGKFAGIYLDPLVTYRAVLKSSDDVTTIYDLDPVGIGSSSVNISFLPSGTGAATRAVQDKLRDTIHAKDYGAKGDGATNDTAALKAAIDALAAMGGGDLLIHAGTFLISSTLDVTTSNIRLIGAGGDTSHGGGTPFTDKTVLKWSGSAGGTMVKLRTPYGATAQARYGQGMIGIELSGGSLAAIGVEIDSTRFGYMANVHVRHCTTTQYNLKAGVTGTDTGSGEAADVQGWKFERCTFDTRNTGYSATSAKGWVLDGSTNANVAGCKWELCNGIYSSGTAWDLVRCDNNIFERCSGFRVAGTGTIYTWTLTGSNSATNAGAYANTFIQCGWDSSLGFSMGASSGGDSFNVRVNTVLNYDQANGGLAPVVGANSTVVTLANDGTFTSLRRVAVTQGGATGDDGITITQGSNRHDFYVNGATLTYQGNGFVGTFRASGNINVVSAVGAYQVDGTQVVQTRKTGWAADTGTAKRTTNATYSATASGTYTQAELQAAMNAIRDISQTVKALKDDLISHGLIGA